MANGGILLSTYAVFSTSSTSSHKVGHDDNIHLRLRLDQIQSLRLFLRDRFEIEN